MHLPLTAGGANSSEGGLGVSCLTDRQTESHVATGGVLTAQLDADSVANDRSWRDARRSAEWSVTAVIE